MSNCICGIKIGVLASSAVDRGCEPQSVKPKSIKLIFVASPLTMRHSGERTKTGWLWIRIMCQSRATCLSADCCFSELALYKPNTAGWSSTKHTSSSFHWKLTSSHHAENLLNNKQSLTHLYESSSTYISSQIKIT